MPTILDLANIDHPDQFNGRPVHDMQGKSVLDLFEGKVNKPYEGAANVGYELFGFKAYFDNDWKILHLPKPLGTGDWELFNLKDDPSEINDLSEQYPEKRQALIDQWEQYEMENGILDVSAGFKE